MYKIGKNSLPLAFIDIDATLQEPGRPVSAPNRKAVADYLAQNGRISFATGKHPMAIADLLKDFPQAGPHIALNGGVIIEGKHLRQMTTIENTAANIEIFLRQNRIEYVAYFMDGLIGDASLLGPKNTALLLSYGEPQPELMEKAPHSGLIKILAFVDVTDKKTEKMFRKKAEELNVRAIRTTGHFLEFISRDSGKEEAVRVIVEESKWPLARTIAIGDSENDLGMLKLCGKSYAVANATDTVRATVDEVVPSCNDDGVAFVLNLLRKEKKSENCSSSDTETESG